MGRFTHHTSPFLGSHTNATSLANLLMFGNRPTAHPPVPPSAAFLLVLQSHIALKWVGHEMGGWWVDRAHTLVCTQLPLRSWQNSCINKSTGVRSSHFPIHWLSHNCPSPLLPCRPISDPLSRCAAHSLVPPE